MVYEPLCLPLPPLDTAGNSSLHSPALNRTHAAQCTLQVMLRRVALGDPVCVAQFLQRWWPTVGIFMVGQPASLVGWGGWRWLGSWAVQAFGRLGCWVCPFPVLILLGQRPGVCGCLPSV